MSPIPSAADWVDQAGRLSERAALWIVEVLGTVRKERGYRKVEHACLDDAEKRGLIQQ